MGNSKVDPRLSLVTLSLISYLAPSQKTPLSVHIYNVSTLDSFPFLSPLLIFQEI